MHLPLHDAHLAAREATAVIGQVLLAPTSSLRAPASPWVVCEQTLAARCLRLPKTFYHESSTWRHTQFLFLFPWLSRISISIHVDGRVSKHCMDFASVAIGRGLLMVPKADGVFIQGVLV